MMTTSARIDEERRPYGLSAEENELRWMTHTVGISSLDGVGWIRVTGEDRRRWLNGMVTNSIEGLMPGEGNYSFALNAQGRIQGDLWAFADEDAIWIETGKNQVLALMAHFERFIIMDDVELEDVSAGRVGTGLIGPQAAKILRSFQMPVVERVRRAKADWHGAEVEVISTGSRRFPRYELWTDAESAESLRESLLAEAVALREPSGAGVVGAESQEWLRVMEQRPVYGVDIRDKELPQETGQTKALHFAKGCYLGQEIVERIRSRGNVHRQFSGFRLSGSMPAAGAILESDGKAVGELTSVAEIPVGDHTMRLGLGYVRREVVERGAELRYVGGEISGSAWVSPPFAEKAGPPSQRDASEEID